MTGLRPTKPTPYKPTEVEYLIKVMDKQRFARGKLQGTDIDVELNGRTVHIFVSFWVDGHLASNSGRYWFLRKKTATRYFEELVKQYNLTEIGREKQ